MKTIRVIGICAFLGLVSTGDLQAGFEVRFAKKDITPADFMPIYMGGRFFDKADDVATDLDTLEKEKLYARSMVLRDENGTIITLTYLDLPGISNRIIGNILEGVDDETGIPPENQFVGATHTHSAPDLQGLFGGAPEAYKRWVEAQTIEAVKEAYNDGNLIPAEMWVATTEAVQKDNWNRRDWGDLTDKNITLVWFENSSGETIGSLLNFAAHPVVREKDKKISRDFCGYVVNQLETTLGGTAIFTNGVVGDVYPQDEGGSLTHQGDERSQKYGQSIANQAIAAMNDPNKKDKIQPHEVTIEKIYWDLTVTGFLYNLAYIFGLLDYDGRWEDQKLKMLTSLTYLRFGDKLEAVTFPGESLTRNGFDDDLDGTCAIKEAMASDRHKLFLGLTGDSLGYFVPSDEWGEWRNNNYNEIVSPGKAVGDQARDLLVNVICPTSGSNCPTNCP